jgi:hypothetical protein
MEEVSQNRFVVDENEVVVDNMAYFVYQTLQAQKDIHDERFSFVMNRVFREYLLPGNDDDTFYKPLSITWLLRMSDASASFYLREKWGLRYGINLSCEQTEAGTYFCNVSKTVDDTTYTITGAEESDTETLACLLALSAACLEWSTIQRTEQYHTAKQPTE